MTMTTMIPAKFYVDWDVPHKAMQELETTFRSAGDYQAMREALADGSMTIRQAAEAWIDSYAENFDYYDEEDRPLVFTNDRERSVEVYERLILRELEEDAVTLHVRKRSRR